MVYFECNKKRDIKTAYKVVSKKEFSSFTFLYSVERSQ